MVNAFQYGLVEGYTAYLLTHFHSDHYARLSKTFSFPVYFSEIMAICQRANFMRENNISTHGQWTLTIWWMLPELFCMMLIPVQVLSWSCLIFLMVMSHYILATSKQIPPSPHALPRYHTLQPRTLLSILSRGYLVCHHCCLRGCNSKPMYSRLGLILSGKRRSS